MAGQLYTPNEAFLYAKTMVKSMRLEDVRYQILDDAAKMIWNAAPWPWTVGFLTTITVLASTVDYAVTIPSDFQHIIFARLVDTTRVYKPLWIDSQLPADPISLGQPLSIAQKDTDEVRIFPKPPATIPSTAQKILIWYKMTMPNITSSNYTTAGAQKLDDQYFGVYKLAVLYFAFTYANDERAGGAVYEPKSESYRFTGTRALLEAELQMMRERVPLPFRSDVYADSPVTRH